MGKVYALFQTKTAQESHPLRRKYLYGLCKGVAFPSPPGIMFDLGTISQGGKLETFTAVFYFCFPPGDNCLSISTNPLSTSHIRAAFKIIHGKLKTRALPEGQRSVY